LYEGKIVLVTGGSRGGILKECAKQFLIHGAKRVFMMARNAQKLGEVCTELSEFGPCTPCPGDVTDIAKCSQAVEKIVKEYGHIDVLLNGAAGNFLASAEKLSENAVKKVLDIDTLGTFNMSQSVFKHAFKKQKSGVIINMSAYLHYNGSWGQLHSAAAKAGVNAMTKVLAAEWGPYGVRVCGIMPGGIKDTEGFSRLGDIGNINNKKRSNESFHNKDAEI
jgi:2,4-dienoyl-CoA reductase [(3E)-enoyl-CoA-producing], peroxisomal